MRLRIAWPRQLVREPPQLVSMALAALIAVEAAHASMLLIGGSWRTHQPARAVPRPPRRAEVDVPGILGAHLFGVFADPRVQDPANAPLSSANLVLSGTIATQNPSQGFAIIRGDDAGNVYKVGDGVGGASLRFVYLDRVILNRGGSLETLRLPRSTLPETAAAKTARRPAAAIADADASPSLEPMEPHTAADVIRATPSFGQPGKLRGFRIYPTSEDSTIFEQSGLRSGDLMIAINGASLNDQGARQGQEIFDILRTSSEATVTIQRNGHTQNVTINTTEPTGR